MAMNSFFPVLYISYGGIHLFALIVIQNLAVDLIHRSKNPSSNAVFKSTY